MSPIDTAELRRLWEAATKGQWAVEPVDVFGRAVLCRGARRMFPIPANDAAFMAASHNALPALLDELEAARLEMRRQASVIAEFRQELREESNRWVSVIRGIDPEALCDFHDEHGSQEYLKSWLAARDRRQKLIGAAEELEQSAKTLREDLADMNPPEFASLGKVAPGYCECLQGVADGMEERAAQLRQMEGEKDDQG